MSVFIDIALTTLPKPLCLLLCKKLKIPSNAKPTKPEIIALKIPLVPFLPMGNLGTIKCTSFLIYDVQFYIWVLIWLL